MGAGRGVGFRPRWLSGRSPATPVFKARGSSIPPRPTLQHISPRVRSECPPPPASVPAVPLYERACGRCGCVGGAPRRGGSSVAEIGSGRRVAGTRLRLQRFLQRGGAMWEAGGRPAGAARRWPSAAPDGAWSAPALGAVAQHAERRRTDLTALVAEQVHRDQHQPEGARWDVDPAVVDAEPAELVRACTRPDRPDPGRFAAGPAADDRLGADGDEPRAAHPEAQRRAVARRGPHELRRCRPDRAPPELESAQPGQGGACAGPLPAVGPQSGAKPLTPNAVSPEPSAPMIRRESL